MSFFAVNKVLLLGSLVKILPLLRTLLVPYTSFTVCVLAMLGLTLHCKHQIESSFLMFLSQLQRVGTKVLLRVTHTCDYQGFKNAFGQSALLTFASDLVLDNYLLKTG